MDPKREDIQEILSLFSSKNFRLAETKVKNLLDKYENNLILYNIYGMVLSKLKKSNETISCFEKAIKINPDNFETYNNFGVALINLGDIENAINNYKKSLNLKSDFIQAKFNLAIAYLKTERYKEAIKEYKEVIDEQPNHAHAYNGLGKIYRYQNKIKDSVINYRKALEINPNLMQVHMHLSYVIKYDSDNHPHIKEMKEAILNENINDENKMYLAFGLGKAFHDIKNYKKAFKYYQEANYIRKNELGYVSEKNISLYKDLKNIFQKELFNKFKNCGSLDKTAIFIVGMPRSGTTLIEQILSSHPKVYGGGELLTLEKIINKYFSLNNLSNANPMEFKKLGNDYIDEIRKLSKKSSFITNKLPLNFLWIGLIKIALPNSKIIHCLRDSKDTCLSIFRTYFGAAGNRYAYNLNDLGNYYNLYQDLMKYWNKTLPNYIYEISYEELISNQKEQTKELLNACNLEWDEKCLKFHKNIRPVRTASSTQVRNPVYSDSINTWKNYKSYLQPLVDILN